MQKPDTYEVIREYDNQYGLEELVRRIIRCHIEDSHEEIARSKFPEYTAQDSSEPLIG